MQTQFPPLNDKQHFPMLVAWRGALDMLMGCENLLFSALANPASANQITRMPGVEWHLYGDTRWPSLATWIEFPLQNYRLPGRGGVLVLRAEIPGDESHPFEWVAANHPLAQILTAMRPEATVRRIAGLLQAQGTSDEIIPGPADQVPKYVQGYCIFKTWAANAETEFVASYTDLLNKEGVVLPRFRMGDVKPSNIGLCQFSLHALFRLNETRLGGTPFAEFRQLDVFEPAWLGADAIPPKWSNFHPCRVLRTHPVIRALPSPAEMPNGFLNQSEFENIVELRRQESNAHLLAFEREARASETAMAREQIDSNATVGAYHHRAHGGAIYVLPDRLVEEFDHTDCSEVQVSDIVLPFQSVFLKFTPPVAIRLDNVAHVDGCYVDHQSDELLLVLTSKLDGVDYERSLSVACIDPIFSLHLPSNEPTMTIVDAVERGIDDFLSRNAPPTEDNSGTFERPDGSIAHVVDIRAKSRRGRIEKFRSQEPAFRACLNIIINAACFIAFRPDDIVDDWAGQPPVDMLAAANAVSNSRRSADKKAGALQKIERGDYTRVKICGRSLFSDDPPRIETGRGTSPRAHWRRGHWRRQRHGAGLLQIALRWIRPTIVKKENLPLVETRYYDV